MKANNIIKLLENNKVVIPPIQRDYVQGRSSGNVPYIRDRFLNSIKDVLLNDDLPKLELDFIYGYEEVDNSLNKSVSIFKPLDGQQRLTTLFLIHWFVAVKEDKLNQIKELLSNFSYSTRKSSRDFCQKLVQFKPLFNDHNLREEIFNQPWFFSTWLNDPTILSMLVMLEEIERNFSNIPNIWDKLTSDTPRISFHLLSMEEIGLPDDLYIKMNARGKSLTDFEHFKSQFSSILDVDNAKIFNEKIDKEWSDLFWNIFKDKSSEDIAKDVDAGFLSFFWFITDLIINKNKIEVSNIFWLTKIKMVYAKSQQNVTFLFDSLELFVKYESSNPHYFDDIFYVQADNYDQTKTRLFFTNSQPNLFRKCAETYGYDSKRNAFSVGEQLMLYAFIYINLEKIELDKRKFRLLRNIFASSEDQLRNEYLISFLYSDVESLINTGEYSESSKLSKRQLMEEKNKASYLETNEKQRDDFYLLEDNRLLRGNIAIIDFNENFSSYSSKFNKIFNDGCDYYSISKAMLTYGNYTQNYGKNRRFGNHNNSTWREIFTQSENRGDFKSTKTVLKKYLDDKIDNELLTDDAIIGDYLACFANDSQLCKDFLYYYIKYKSFLFWCDYGTEGYYSWENFETRPYENWMLFRKQFNGRHWNPFLLELSDINNNCTLENYGNSLQFTNETYIFLITNENTGFRFSPPHNDEVSKATIDHLIKEDFLDINGVFFINQNEGGVDMEDRIFKLNSFLNSLIENESKLR